MPTIIDLLEQDVTILRPRYSLGQLLVATREDPKSQAALNRLITQVIPRVCTQKEMKLLALSSEPGEEISCTSGYEFCSVELALSFMAHVVHDNELMGRLCRNDPRPLICMDPIMVPSKRLGREPSLKHIIMGIDATDRFPTPQIRLIGSKKVEEVCGGYYRPVCLKLEEAEEEIEEGSDSK